MARQWLIPILILIGVIVFASQGLKGGPEISVTEAAALLKAVPRPLVIDVREREQYEQSHIAGALSVPSTEFKARLESLKLPKFDPVVIYGADDVLAREATKHLYESGYHGALTLKGGFNAWRAAGQAVIKKPQP